MSQSSCSKGDKFCHSTSIRQMEASARTAAWGWPLPKPSQMDIYRLTGSHAGPCTSSPTRAASLVSWVAQGALILCVFPLSIVLSRGRIHTWSALGRLVMG